MRKLEYIEKVIAKEIEPHLVRNKERGHKRHLKNTLYDYRERERLHYKTGSRSLIILVKAGIPYMEACNILNKTI